MSNVLAIAQKEIRSYFASPIAYAVIAAFALLFGFFYVAVMGWFVEQSMAGAMGGGGPVNINQMMIRPLFQNAAVVLLFIVPMVTMRTYSEEKKSGTIELLLTSPVTDLQIVLGKFLGALVLYVAMLAVTLVHIGLLFAYSNPEWSPIIVGYLGMMLLGGAFISVGLFMSSLTKNQMIAGVLTFLVLLLLWVLDWMSNSAGPTLGPLLSYVSMTSHLDDFTKGVIDTRHLIYYLSFITFGLFLTLKAVDSERWRG